MTVAAGIVAGPWPDCPSKFARAATLARHFRVRSYKSPGFRARFASGYGWRGRYWLLEWTLIDETEFINRLHTFFRAHERIPYSIRRADGTSSDFARVNLAGALSALAEFSDEASATSADDDPGHCAELRSDRASQPPWRQGRARIARPCHTPRASRPPYRPSPFSGSRTAARRPAP